MQRRLFFVKPLGELNDKIEMEEGLKIVTNFAADITVRFI
jgi:hypothetical protein